MRKKTWALGESGAGSVLGVGLIAMLVALFGLLQIPIQREVAQAQTQVAADQAAVAAADSLRGLATGIPCEVASLLVAQNHAEIVTCRVVANSVYVSARINPFIVAEARAGI